MHYLVVAILMRLAQWLYYSAGSSNANGVRCYRMSFENMFMKLKNVSLRYKNEWCNKTSSCGRKVIII